MLLAMRQHVNKAINLAGSKAELARKLGVTAGFIQKMHRSGHVPAAQCRKVEIICRGEVTAEMLRPDVFSPRWAELIAS